jgi:hypothetical protein
MAFVIPDLLNSLAYFIEYLNRAFLVHDPHQPKKSYSQISMFIRLDRDCLGVR